MSEQVKVSGVIGREGVVDGQGEMYAPGVLRAVASQLPRTAVTYGFNRTGGPAGRVENAWMVGPDLWATVIINDDWAPVIEGKPVTIRPWATITAQHLDGKVRVIDKLGIIGVSVVREGMAVCIDVEAAEVAQP